MKNNFYCEYTYCFAVAGCRQSISKSEAGADISMSSSESLSSCMRQDPPGEETQPSGPPSYIHSGCNQYRNNMLAHLGLNVIQPPSSTGMKAPHNNAFYVTGYYFLEFFSIH